MITLSSVTKKFGSITAVDDISLTITKGEYFALLGPNGAGKTTVVRMLLGFSKPSSGNVTLNGVSAGNVLSRMGVGYLAENHRIPSFLSGREYLQRHAALAGFKTKDAKKEIDRVLKTVDMKKWGKKRASTYSKGMIQRIGFASAILGNPKILILDEPVSGLDPIGIRDVRKILESLREYRVTIILNSHFLSEVEKTCDTTAIMHKGKIIAKGSIGSITKDGESLEDVFIRLIEDKNE